MHEKNFQQVPCQSSKRKKKNHIQRYIDFFICWKSKKREKTTTTDATLFGELEQSKNNSDAQNVIIRKKSFIDITTTQARERERKNHNNGVNERIKAGRKRESFCRSRIFQIMFIPDKLS